MYTNIRTCSEQSHKYSFRIPFGYFTVLLVFGSVFRYTIRIGFGFEKARFALP